MAFMSILAMSAAFSVISGIFIIIIVILIVLFISALVFTIIGAYLISKDKKNEQDYYLSYTSDFPIPYKRKKLPRVFLIIGISLFVVLGIIFLIWLFL